MRNFIDIVFDGPPDQEAPRFIEVEDETGNSINVGDWLQRIDGRWVLRLSSRDFPRTESWTREDEEGKRNMLRDHLALAEQHVSQGERHIVRQRELVAELQRDGHDTTLAEELLKQFEGLQVIHVADRDRLKRELHALS